MLNVFDLHLSAPDEKAVSRICASNQETYANIWLVLTIQMVMPVGFCYLTFVCENKQRNQCNSVNLLRKFVKEKLSIIDPKDEKPLQFLIPLTLLLKNHNLFCEGLKKSGERKGKSVTTSL
jgi:hypothetical protein